MWPKLYYIVLRVDGFNPASVAGAGNQGPPQMMGMGMNARGGAMGPEGTPNMGAPLLPENGAMVTYAQIMCFVSPFYISA